MKKIVIFILIIFSINLLSQNKENELLTNGYYFSEIKELKNEVGNLKWLNSLKSDDIVYSIKPIILNETGNFSISDNFYGIIDNQNSFLGSHKKLQKFLKKRYSLNTKGKYFIKNNKIFLSYETYDKKSVKIKGIVLNNRSFILQERYTYLGDTLLEEEKIKLQFQFAPIHKIKKIYFLNEEQDVINKQKYIDNPLNKSYYEFEIENDTAIFFTKVYTKEFGRLSEKINNLIRNELSRLSNKKIDSNKTIIINYIPENDRCRGNKRWSYSLLKKYKKYSQEIKKKKNVIQFFIFKDESIVRNFSKKFKWYKDENQIIEKEFFKFHYPCGSYVIIKPNGNYYTKRGEYDISRIPSELE